MNSLVIAVFALEDLCNQECIVLDVFDLPDLTEVPFTDEFYRNKSNLLWVFVVVLHVQVN
jgi:hypothetical protein